MNKKEHNLSQNTRDLLLYYYVKKSHLKEMMILRYISDVLEEKIEKIFIEKGYLPLYTPDKKILILDEDFTTHYKIDINYNNSDFSCIVLKRRERFLTDLKNFNIPWTNGEEIANFLDFLRSN